MVLFSYGLVEFYSRFCLIHVSVIYESFPVLCIVCLVLCVLLSVMPVL